MGAYFFKMSLPPFECYLIHYRKRKLSCHLERINSFFVSKIERDEEKKEIFLAKKQNSHLFAPFFCLLENS
jgi:hypothetical protein